MKKSEDKNGPGPKNTTIKNQKKAHGGETTNEQAAIRKVVTRGLY